MQSCLVEAHVFADRRYDLVQERCPVLLEHVCSIDYYYRNVLRGGQIGSLSGASRSRPRIKQPLCGQPPCTSCSGLCVSTPHACKRRRPPPRRSSVFRASFDGRRPSAASPPTCDIRRTELVPEEIPASAQPVHLSAGIKGWESAIGPAARKPQITLSRRLPRGPLLTARPPQYLMPLRSGLKTDGDDAAATHEYLSDASSQRGYRSLIPAYLHDSLNPVR